MLKDGFFPMGWEFMLHHILCIMLGIFFLQNDNTPGIFMLGSCTMEVGSASQSLHYLFPKSNLIKIIHFFIMSMSNGLSFWLVYIFLENSQHLSSLVSTLLTLAVGGLAASRQVFCFINVGLIGNGYSKPKEI